MHAAIIGGNDLNSNPISTVEEDWLLNYFRSVGITEISCLKHMEVPLYIAAEARRKGFKTRVISYWPSMKSAIENGETSSSYLAHKTIFAGGAETHNFAQSDMAVINGCSTLFVLPWGKLSLDMIRCICVACDLNKNPPGNPKEILFIYGSLYRSIIGPDKATMLLSEYMTMYRMFFEFRPLLFKTLRAPSPD